MSEPSYRRLSDKSRKWIGLMIDSGEWKGTEIASIFGISRSRVSQIKGENGLEEAVALD